ncbi:hypothetical protein FB45DRAFT_941009 [Roridomyces roridus]|uniref:Uncharacterized protein n=1 Tax=Roridomyces roridus TaxID=1738132 RepID=A0AAD7B6V8_9AGAR|nr:hypothetical protein FB45DRAFT_941009 [Roridomyces roridus]
MSSTRALTAAQERRLVTYLDDKLLELTRGYKKRSEENAVLPTLTLYLDAATRIMAMILQIPPVDPSTAVRTAFLLRLTHDVLASIPGYPADPITIPYLQDWLDDLDQAWSAVLQAQIWHPDHGVSDLVLSADEVAAGKKSSAITQTESTRLRSLLIGGSATIEEWLGGQLHRRPRTIDEEDEEEEEDMECVADVEGMLERLGVQDDYDQLFSRTLHQLGALSGFIPPT